MLPSISSALQLLPPAGHLGLTRSDLVATHSASLSERPGLVEAFHLALVLHLLISNEKSGQSASPRNQSTPDVWSELQQAARRKHSLELLASELMEYIPRAVEDQDSFDVEDILCAAFPFDSSQSRMIRVIDLLDHPGIPSEILCHPLITVAVSRLWKYNRVPSSHEIPLVQRALTLYDASSAPRFQHAVHLAFHLAYLALFAHLILYPSSSIMLPYTSARRGPIDVRELLMIIYSATNIVFGSIFSLVSLPHFIVLIFSLLSLPTSPSPESWSYTALLFAFSLHIMFLQLPIPPSPSFLVEPALSLPLSSLYHIFFERCFFPIFAFLLPIILPSVVLFSFSLSETLLLNVSTLTAPPAARVTFLGLVVISFCHLVFFSGFVPLFAPSSLRCVDTSLGHWEGYGIYAGILGRRALIRAVCLYSASASGLTTFPPPFNIFSIPLAIVPISLKAKRIVWRIFVGPVAFCVAVFWCWGLL